MRSGKGWIFLLFICLFSGLRLSQAQQPLTCVAVITEINGETLLKKFNKSESTNAAWGTQLFQGDEIKTSDKSDVKLLFSNNTLISLGPNSMIKISGEKSSETEISGHVRNISSATLVDLSAFTFKREDKKDVGALADLRSAGGDH
jgi:hypothetical protein